MAATGMEGRVGVASVGGDALGDLLEPGAQRKNWQGSPCSFARWHFGMVSANENHQEKEISTYRCYKAPPVPFRIALADPKLGKPTAVRAGISSEPICGLGRTRTEIGF